MTEYKPEDVFEKNVRRLIESSVPQTEPDRDAAFKQKLTDSVLVEVEQVHAGASARRIRLIGRLTAAAVIVIVVSLFLVHRGPDEQSQDVTISQLEKSPAEMMTAMSLKIAYRKGGLEAVDERSNKALELLGPPPPSPSLRELLEELSRM